MSIPTAIREYAFSGSLCRIREFETLDGLRYCLTVFSLSDYKYLHLPHDDYKLLISKLYALLSTQAIYPTASNSDVLNIKQIPFDGDFKIEIGRHMRLTIGSVTAFGLVKSTPFTDFDVFSNNKNRFTCDSKWDICICKECPVFTRLVEYEESAQKLFSVRRPVNVILT